MTIKIADPMGLYRASFGDMIDGTVYSDGIRGINKGINVGAASGAAGYATIPVVMDPEVVDITRTYTPIQLLLKKRSNAGITANYYRLTARSAATWGAMDSTIPADADDTREALAVDMKALRIVGSVDGVAQAAGAHFANILNDEVQAKTITMTETIEDALVNGDTVGTPTEPNGLIKLVSANLDDLTGAAVTLSDVNDLLDTCFLAKGHINLLVTDPRTLTAIKLQMLDYVKYVNPSVKLGWGLEAVAFNSNNGVVPIIASQYMPAGVGAKRIIALDTTMIEQRVLSEISFNKLAKIDDSERFYLKTYRNNINKFPEGMGQIINIA